MADTSTWILDRARPERTGTDGDGSHGRHHGDRLVSDFVSSVSLSHLFPGRRGRCFCLDVVVVGGAAGVGVA